MWPHYSGPPGAPVPRFIEPPKPPISTPLLLNHSFAKFSLTVKLTQTYILYKLISQQLCRSTRYRLLSPLIDHQRDIHHKQCSSGHHCIIIIIIIIIHYLRR